MYFHAVCIFASEMKDLDSFFGFLGFFCWSLLAHKEDMQEPADLRWEILQQHRMLKKLMKWC